MKNHSPKKPPTLSGHRAPIVKLHPNVKKIIAAISYIIAYAAKKKRAYETSQYLILKTIFLADKSHLNKYGRPITFDNYYAMKDGPVASLTYNLLKGDQKTLKSIHLTSLPWDKTLCPALGSGTYHFSNANVKDIDDILSESDKDMLVGAFQSIQHLTYQQIKKLLHDDPAYVEAWDASKSSVPISFGMIFDAPNFEAAEKIQFLSHQI